MSDWSEGVFDGGAQEVANATGGDFLGGLLGGSGMLPIPSVTGGTAGPSEAKGGTIGGAAFDNSGWNVTFGANSGIESSRAQSTPLAGNLQYVLIGAAFLLAWKYLKKKS